MFPADIIDVVLSFASCPTAAALARSCKTYNQLLNEKGWITLLKSRVGPGVSTVSNEEAKQLLKNCILNTNEKLITNFNPPSDIQQILIASVGNTGKERTTGMDK